MFLLVTATFMIASLLDAPAHRTNHEAGLNRAARTRVARSGRRRHPAVGR
jgi:hypothetical protein